LEFHYFQPIPSVSLSSQIGYARLSDCYFGARLDFKQRKCYILQQIRDSVNLKKEGYRLEPNFWFMIHEKTNTLYQLIDSNCGSYFGPNRRSRRLQSKIRLEWKLLRKFPAITPDHRIDSFTQDYLLTSEEGVFDHQIQCIRSGRTAELPRCITYIDSSETVIVCGLFNARKIYLFRFNVTSNCIYFASIRDQDI
jgi:hypothetical protein